MAGQCHFYVFFISSTYLAYMKTAHIYHCLSFTHTYTRTRAHTSFFLPLTFSPGQMQALLPLSATFEVTSSWWLMIWWWNMSVGSPLASRIHRCAGVGRVRISVWGSCFLPTLTFKAQDKDTLAAAAICCVPDNLSLEHFWPPPRKGWIATQSQTFYL